MTEIKKPAKVKWLTKEEQAAQRAEIRLAKRRSKKEAKKDVPLSE